MKFLLGGERLIRDRELNREGWLNRAFIAVM